MVRADHPLEGRWLEVIGCRRGCGALGLIVVVPDGSRRVIPAEWSDVHGPRVPPRLGTLGSLEDLLAARRVVDWVAARGRGRGERTVIGAVWRRIWRCYRSDEGHGGSQRGLERVDLRPAGPESGSIGGFAVLGGAVLSCSGAMISLARSEAMQLCLDLGGSSAPAAALWELVG